MFSPSVATTLRNGRFMNACRFPKTGMEAGIGQAGVEDIGNLRRSLPLLCRTSRDGRAFRYQPTLWISRPLKIDGYPRRLHLFPPLRCLVRFPPGIVELDQLLECVPHPHVFGFVLIRDSVCLSAP